ncbi:hypothetical protein DFH27DRAFT_656345 [Peziza echinospora]|nr:hypothetical protein DFH27DRAFT_656345 [Peziza echinospora]
MCSGDHHQPPPPQPNTPQSPSSSIAGDSTPTPPHLHLFNHGEIHDAHCHPTDLLFHALKTTNGSSNFEMKTLEPDAIASLMKEHLSDVLTSMNTKILAAMATRSNDQALVRALANLHPDKIVPGFGYHPWFSYMIWDDSDAALVGEYEKAKANSKDGKSDLDEAEVFREFKSTHYLRVLKPSPPPEFIHCLPTPRALKADILAELRTHISEFKGTGRPVVLGEVGLDRGFRIPWAQGYTPPPSPRYKQFSPYHVDLKHQMAVFLAQLGVAGEFGVPASLHSVGAHGAMYEALKGLWKGWEIETESVGERRRREKRATHKAANGGRGLTEDERRWIRKWKEHMVYDSEEEEEESDSDSDPEDEHTGSGDEEGGVPKLRKEKKKKPDTTKSTQTNQPQLGTPAKTPPQGPPPFPPRICLHSFSAPKEGLSQYLLRPTPTTIYPTQIFYSFSTTINASPPRRPPTGKEDEEGEKEKEKGKEQERGDYKPSASQEKKLEEVIRLAPEGRVMVESDWHSPGQEMDAHVCSGVEMIRRVRGWGEEEAVRRLAENWRAWVFGREEGDEGGDE